MNRQEIFNHFSDIIDSMIDNSLFWKTYFQQPYGFGDAIDGRDYDELPANLLICSGATRTCLIDDDYDWVVKFDVAEDALGSACEREEEIYNAAKAYALDRYFAEVAYIGSYTRTINFYDYYNIERNCNFYEYEPILFNEEFLKNVDNFGLSHSITICIPLYAYRKATAYDCGPVDANSKALAQQIESPLRSRNIAVATAFIREYGMEEYELFSEFGFNWDINDLHCNNVGKIDGHMILIDYSGYHDGYSEATEATEE